MSLPSLRKNILALGGLQAANYLIPLLTVPYLTRTLGVHAWGKIAFAQVIFQYLVVLTDYGFSWSSVRYIAEKRGDYEAISEVFSATWIAQWILVGICALLLSLVVMLSGMLRDDWRLYFVGFSVVIGNVLFPQWLLQGLERLREVCAIQVISRLVLILPLFILVRSPADTVIAMAIQSCSAIAAGLLSLYWIRRHRLAGWRRPTSAAIRSVLRDGMEIFFSRIWISVYTSLIPIALGAVAGATEVGVFTLADRARQAAQSVIQPISQALFPRMSHLYVHNIRGAHALLVKSLYSVLIVSGSASLALWVAARPIILLLGGEEFAHAASVLRCLAVIPILIGLSNLLGVQVMIPNSRTRAFSLILTMAAALAMLLIVPLALAYGARGAAVTAVCAELVVTVTMGIYLWRTGFLQALTARL